MNAKEAAQAARKRNEYVKSDEYVRVYINDIMLQIDTISSRGLFSTHWFIPESLEQSTVEVIKNKLKQLGYDVKLKTPSNKLIISWEGK